MAPAPSLVQALISDLLRDVGRDGVVLVQYLDDIPLEGGDKDVLKCVTEAVVQARWQAGFLISEKSVCEP